MGRDDVFSQLRRLEGQLGQAMRRDRFRLLRSLRAVARNLDRDRGDAVRQLARLGEQLERSIALRRTRAASVPALGYDDDLPITACRHQIAGAIREHPVVIVCGETGSGKSTQLPKICLGLGRGVGGSIGHTQPRRIAARSIAARVAEELGVALGRAVGFKTRFAEAVGPETLVKVMTDGILLAETQSDRFLDQYDTIILDEAHERSLNIDFLLGYLKRLLPKRPDLKLIITSATLDAVRFSRHFTVRGRPAPVVEISGRSWPVEIRYRPPVADQEGEEPELVDAVLAAVDELAAIDAGDILVFMPTERHIHETAKALRGHAIPGDGPGRRTEILPLYARLPGKEQQRVFQPHRHRRIVIATNVAESSLTVPGVRYVIDPGTARISRYAPRSRTQRLPIEAVSQASADQRAGRCGRLGPGICIRLYSQADYEARDRYTPPEIQRTNLASVILQTKALHLGPIERFPFLDPPRRQWIRDGQKTLFEIGAVDEGGRLTEIGRRLSRLPVDPRIGRMILAADDDGCLSEMLIIAAALEIRDPRERPLDKQEAADEAHARFAHGESDFLTYLALWDFYHRLKETLSRSQLRRACRQHFLSHNRLREWSDIHRQLREWAHQAGLKPGRRRDEYEPIHRAILTGMLSGIAMRTGPYEYRAAGGGTFHLWPGSATFSRRPDWIVAAERVETTRRYLRTCAPVDPAWIERLASHLVKRTYHDPHWDPGAASAMAYEQVSLFGLPIVARRRVPYPPVAPKTARAMLIQHGLVEGQLDLQAEFLRHNRQLIKHVERLQAKTRRNDLLLGEWAQFDFYDRQLPDDVCDGRRLQSWLRRARRRNARVLFMEPRDLLREDPGPAVADRFPDTLPAGSTALPLDYRFQPGTEQDGVSVRVPLQALGQLDPRRLEWLVPGLLEEKIAALVKTLPKPIRRPLVPAMDTARRLARTIPFGQGDLLQVVAGELTRMAGQVVSPDMFDLERLPPHLRMNVQVIAQDARVVAEGRDVQRLRRKLGDRLSQCLAAVDDPAWNRDGLTTWDFDRLPERVELCREGLTVCGYPMLIDRGSSVSLRLAPTARQARHYHRGGLRRLFVLAAQRPLRQQVAWLPDLDRLRVYAASIPQFDLQNSLVELLADRAFFDHDTFPATREEFARRVEEARQRIGMAVQEVVELVGPLLESYHHARLALEKATRPIWAYAAEDIRQQMAELLRPDFLTATPWDWLRHYPRYFRGISYRLERLAAGSLQRDRRHTEEIQQLWSQYLERANASRGRGLHDLQLDRYRWMLEEYRISCFAQPLGTALTISRKRLDRQWQLTQDPGG